MKKKPSLSDFSPSIDLGDRRVAIDPETRRIAVRVAKWDENHSGFGEVVRMPRQVNLDAAHIGHADLEDGSSIRVASLPMSTMHAPKDMQAMHAASWYENTGESIARVRYSEDEEGIRADGVLFDDVDDARIDRITASSASGDWRSAIAIKRFSDFEHTPADFVGSCLVNLPGFSDTFAKKQGQNFALAASAHSIISIEDEAVEDVEATSVDRALTASGGGEGDGCGGQCDSCVCGANGQAADEPSAELIEAAALLASHFEAQGVEVPEQLSTLTAALGERGWDELDSLRDRVEELEQIVYEALSSI